MKKDRFITLCLCFVVTFLTCWLFWETVAKNFIEDYIKDNYGTELLKTFNNTELIKNFDIPMKDDKSTS